MSSVNKVTLVGRLGKDPELHYMPNGTAVATISLATSDKWRDKTTGETKERTEWHRVVLWGKRAEVAGEYLRKGSQIYIQGSLRTRKWQDNAGLDRYTTEINVSVDGDMQMLGNAPSRDGQSQPQRQPADQPQPQPQSQGWGQPQPQYSGENNGSQQSGVPAPHQEMDFDDDIPF